MITCKCLVISNIKQCHALLRNEIESLDFTKQDFESQLRLKWGSSRDIPIHLAFQVWITFQGGSELSSMLEVLSPDSTEQFSSVQLWFLTVNSDLAYISTACWTLTWYVGVYVRWWRPRQLHKHHNWQKIPTHVFTERHFSHKYNLIGRDLVNHVA